jgi:hypothetical protein
MYPSWVARLLRHPHPGATSRRGSGRWSAALLAAALSSVTVLTAASASVGEAASEPTAFRAADATSILSEPRQRPRQVGASRRAGVGSDLLSAAELGHAIALEAGRRDRGWGDATATVRMIVRDGGGRESAYDLRSEHLEGGLRGDRLLLIAGGAAGGVRLALLTHGDTPVDAQWLYRGADDGVERIAASDRSRPFLGSEFTYEDLAPKSTAEFTYRWLRDETRDGLDLVLIERYPVDDTSLYGRQVVWIDQHEYRVWRVDYYDRRGDLLKTLRVLRYGKYAGDFWRPRVLHMVNHQSGASTTLQWSDYRFGTGLQEEDLDRSRLTRLR